MTNEEIRNKLISFDNMLAEANGKRENIAPKSIKWEVASVERYKLLENLWGKEESTTSRSSVTRTAAWKKSLTKMRTVAP